MSNSDQETLSSDELKRKRRELRASWKAKRGDTILLAELYHLENLVQQRRWAKFFALLRADAIGGGSEGGT